MTASVLPNVSRETAERLASYVNLLIKWQRSINLISARTVADIWSRHVADCAQLADHAEGRVWIDLGAGAGFPGLVIAAIRPETDVVLIESDGRKCAFLRLAAAEMNVRASVHHGRIEQVVPSLNAIPNVVTARALAPLDRLMAYAAPCLTKGAVGLFPKGQDHLAELTAARKSWQFEADLLPSTTDSQARIIRVREFQGRQQGLPNG